MSVGIEQLLADIGRLPDDDRAADACEWLGAAIARQVDISPRLAAIVMRHYAITPEQLRAVAHRHARRRDLAATYRAGRRAAERLDAARRRAATATSQAAQAALDTQRAVQAGERAWMQLLDPALLSADQAERWRAAQDRHAAAAAALEATAEQHRIAELRLQSVRDQVHAAAGSHPCQGAALVEQRWHVDELTAQADALREQVDERQIAAAIALADVEHLRAELTGDAH